MIVTKNRSFEAASMACFAGCALAPQLKRAARRGSLDPDVP
jgi:hypothetical protein